MTSSLRPGDDQHTGCLGAPERTDVVAAVSHEIRTPVAVIQGYLELLADTPGAIDHRFRRQVDAINRNAARLCRTIDNLLWAVSHQRVLPVKGRAVDATDLVRSCVGACDGENRVSVEAPPAPVWIRADPALLSCAVENLISNALAYSTHDVTVTVTGEGQPVITVIDRGVGMETAEMHRLGDPFFRGRHALRGELPGLGLGLPITEWIVAGHGGSLVLHSAVDEGTTARILLPQPSSETADRSASTPRFLTVTSVESGLS